MKLTFNREGVERLLSHAKAAPEHSPTYGQEPPIKPGLILVGDQGVYLMSNGLPMLKVDNSESNFVVYADQINPDTMPFDVWWAVKESAFGGDDGADPIDADTIELNLAAMPGLPLTIVLTPAEIKLMVVAQKPSKPSPKKR
jgi:hypothetical protein